MVRIEKVRFNDGAGYAVVDIQVSTTAELPAIGETICSMKVNAGSIAQIIQTGAWCTLDENGTWYDETGTPASSESNNSLNASLSMSPTLNKAIVDSTDDMIDLTENDIDRISDELEEPAVKEQKKTFEESIEEPEKDGEDDDELL